MVFLNFHKQGLLNFHSKIVQMQKESAKLPSLQHEYYETFQQGMLSH